MENVTSVVGQEFVANSVAEVMQNWINPLGLSLSAWVAFGVAKTTGQVLYDEILSIALRTLKVPKMPSRTPPIMKGLERLETKDYIYLAINQVIELIFVMNLFHLAFVEQAESVDHQFSLSALTVPRIMIEIILPMYIFFYVDDLLYYFAHRWMHLPMVYPWIHKHHHRQAFPKRGYLDAGNEHPVEQVLGLSCAWLSLRFLVSLYAMLNTMVHGAGMIFLFFIYANFAFLNHTEYDVKLGMFGLGYTVRAHEMHHRFSTCNYSQNTMLWDRLFGTFLAYKNGQKKKV